MQARHLVMLKEALRATALRDAERALLGVLNHDPLEDGGDTRTDAQVARGTELRYRPALQRLEHVRVRGRGENRCLLRAEGKNRSASFGVGGWTDVPTEGIESANSCITLEEREREAPKSQGTDVDA